jgi:hypothetical protein
MEVIPGCNLSAKVPDLGGSDAGQELERHEPGPGSVPGGRWCADQRYWLDASLIGGQDLELLYREAQVVSSLDGE